MKIFRKIFLMICFAWVTVFVLAQSAAEILKNKETPLIFYGIDFSKTKLIGDAAANTEDIVTRQFPGINDLMLNEFKKYNIAKAFHRSSVEINLEPIAKINKKINAAKLLSGNSEDYAALTEKDIQNAIKVLSVDKATGTGIIFVVDGMSKIHKSIAVWVTVFDIKSKKVLLTERVEGKTGIGFSFRNFWATGFKKVIDQIDSKKYKEWTK